MISRFFTTTFANKRMAYTGDQAGEAEVGEFLGHLQHLTPEARLGLAGSVTATHRIWCPAGTDVQEGDTVRSGGDLDGSSGNPERTFSVRAVLNRDIAPATNVHLVLLVEEDVHPPSV